jgi:hypothetical protein
MLATPSIKMSIFLELAADYVIDHALRKALYMPRRRPSPRGPLLGHSIGQCINETFHALNHRRCMRGRSRQGPEIPSLNKVYVYALE